MQKINYADLPAWITEQLEPFRKSKILLDQFCARTGEDFGLLDSCIYLSNLSVDQIKEVGTAKIPPSCWSAMVVLADEGSDFFKAGMKVAKVHRSGDADDVTPLVIKLRRILGAKKKAGYDPADLRAASTIAQKYSALKPKLAKDIAGMAASLKRNGVLSPKQIGYIGSILGQMKSARVLGKTQAEIDVLGRLYSMID